MNKISKEEAALDTIIITTINERKSVERACRCALIEYVGRVRIALVWLKRELVIYMIDRCMELPTINKIYSLKKGMMK